MNDELTKNQKISQAMKGRTLSEEHKKKLSTAKKGTTRSNAIKAKIKQTMLGDKNTNLKKSHPRVPKSSNSRSDLTAVDVQEIRDRYSNEKATSIRKLAKEFNVSRHTIHSIVTYKIWK